jgi:hypothetical protein
MLQDPTGLLLLASNHSVNQLSLGLLASALDQLSLGLLASALDQLSLGLLASALDQLSLGLLAESWASAPYHPISH